MAQEAPQGGSARTAGELMDAVMWGKEPIGGPFELIDHTGQRRTDADFRDKLMLVYFGFTFVRTCARPIFWRWDWPSINSGRRARRCSRCSSPSIPNATRPISSPSTFLFFILD